MISERDKAMAEWFETGRAPLAWLRDLLIVIALVVWLVEQFS